MPEYKKFTKDVGVVGIAQILKRLRGIILIPILAKTLGASPYGIYATLMVTVNLLTPISVLGLRESMVRFLSGEKNKKEIQEGYYSVLLVVFFASLFLSFLVLIFSQTLANTVFGDPQAVDIIKIGAFLILIGAMDMVNLDLIRASRRMFQWSVFQVSQTLGEVSLAAILVLQGFGLDAVIYSFVSVRLLVFMITFTLIANEIKIKPPNFSKIKPYIAFGLPLVPVSIFAWIVNSSDRYLIGYFLNSSQIGIYSAAYGIASITGMFIMPLSTVLFPSISNLWKENKMHELKNHLTYSLKYFLMLAIPSFFGLSILSKQILRIMTKPEFVSQGYLIIPLVVLGEIFYYSSGMWGWIFVLVKKTHFSAILLGIGAMINIVVNVLLIPKIGILGAAISTLISFTIIGILTIMLTRNYLKFDVDLVFILKSILASSVMALILWKWHPIPFPEVLVSILAGLGIYFIVLILLRGFDKKEIDFFREFIEIAVSKITILIRRL